MSSVLPFRPDSPPVSRVETETYLNIRFIVSDCHANGRLAVVRTSVGMGKTFALQGYAAEHANCVVYLTLNRTTKAVTPGLHAAYDAFADLWDRTLRPECSRRSNLAYPRAIYQLIEEHVSVLRECVGRPLLIVDEAQNAQPDLLEIFRSMYDDGLFGLVVSGNARLFNPRRGRTETADFGALLSRAYHVLDMAAPTPGDVAAMMEAYGISGTEEQALLARSARAGGLRELAQVVQKAYAIAAGPRVTLKDLKMAVGSTGLTAFDRGR